MLSKIDTFILRYHDIMSMNAYDPIEQHGVEEKSDSEESFPVPGYEVIVLDWLEQIRSESSADELIKLEEIN
jgi:hypothetical protein